MRIELKEFQKETIDILDRRVRDAMQDVRRGRGQQIITLSAPTGSGKTVISTALIEGLLDGTDNVEGYPDTTILWLSDQPSINEQTRRKMLATSSTIRPSQVVVIEPPFSQETLEPGMIYFLNTQKLGRDRRLTESDEGRRYSIWQTVRQTVTRRPGSLILIIDEAHRGMTISEQSREPTTTIVQKFIRGVLDGPDDQRLPAIPIIVGLSATPQRFIDLIHEVTALGGIAPTLQQIVVPVKDVRESGLLKDAVEMVPTISLNPDPLALLREAATTLARYTEEWKIYCENQREALVRPLLVVQVENQTGNDESRSQTDLAAAISVIEGAIDSLPATAYAHAFDIDRPVTMGSRSVRHIAPADIQDDPDAQVVFFKTSLNTGWDCPRAEVMMSFRAASDATVIAQLVGRMVRTPLARRIDANDWLNTVDLYLPRYDKDELNHIIRELTGLTGGGRDSLSASSTRVRGDKVIVHRKPGSEALFDELKCLPSYVVPRKTSLTAVQRLCKLGRLLSEDGLSPDAPEQIRSVLLEALTVERNRLAATPEFERIVKQQGLLEVQPVTWIVNGTDDHLRPGETVTYSRTPDNINALFNATARQLREGLHKDWWRHRVGSSTDPTTIAQTKLEVLALCLDGTAVQNVDRVADRETETWLRRHEREIQDLVEGQRQEYEIILQSAKDPQKTLLIPPDTMMMDAGSEEFDKHLYIDDAGTLRTAFKSSWEPRIIREYIPRADVIGWVRNQENKDSSLCVPYEMSGTWHRMYPDFLVIRQTSGRPVVDIIDPHGTHIADAPAKAVGLAKFAARHGGAFGRIEMVIYDKDRAFSEAKTLDLKDRATREHVLTVDSRAHLESIFTFINS